MWEKISIVRVQKQGTQFNIDIITSTGDAEAKKISHSLHILIFAEQANKKTS